MSLHDLGWILLALLTLLAGMAVGSLWRTNAQNSSTKAQGPKLLNWRLILVGATAFELSLASGWTTWDGMRNFTNEPVLSFLITFGIQGVMLVSAWLIGDSFLQSEPFLISGVPPTEAPLSRIAAVAGATMAAALLFLAIGLGLYYWLPATRVTLISALGTILSLLAFAIGIVVFAAALLIAFSRVRIVSHFATGMGTILKSIHIWVMFLVCFAASVFFSFDSLFSHIFPAQERQRAAESRSVSQISGVLSDLSKS